ncbi:MAG: DNA helicase Rep [Methylococcales bacterium]|nr:DNA helicase Rep [Methylococcales bacterium]
MSKLNTQQHAAVKITEQPLLVLAGAGSGKTRVITEKIAHLVNKGLAARHIAALTFTNKAAREMKSRVEKLLDAQQSRGLRVSTFHSLGLDILRREHKVLGYKSGITLFDESDKKTLLKNLINQGVGHCDIDELDYYLTLIGTWKNGFITPEQAINTEDKSHHEAAVLYQTYNRHLKSYNAVDFDDLILLPVLLFQQSSETLEKWQNKIRYLLVDEYQDTNITQYELVRLLAGNLGRFTVVGDDDQSIYAWRGAQPENLSQLQKDYPRLKVIKLEQNYRSMGRILNVANHLIANNPHEFEKRLWSELGYGDPLKVLAHKNEQTEAQQVVSEIIHHKFHQGGRYQDYAILYRGNYQSRLFEHCLRENNIPYFISGSTSFFSYSEVKDVMGYLRLLVNPDDDAAFLRVVNTPRREIGPTTLEKLGGYANERHISLFSACSELGLSQKLPEKAVSRLTKFCQWTTRTAESIENNDNLTPIDTMLVDIGYEQWLKENSKTPEAAKRQQKNVTDLVDWLKRMGTAEEGESEKSLSEVVSKVMLLDILERQEEDEADDQVSLMTLHAAKGLEFPHVFLIGMEENLLPHQNSIEMDNIEEERRLAYVGITRAQRSCTFSYCTHRKRYGEVSETEPSRFLDELPADDLEWTAKNPINPEEVKARGKANFANLKMRLS